MTLCSRRSSLALVILTSFAAAKADAGLIVAGTTSFTSVATMDLRLLAGTVFNPGPNDIILTGVSGSGVLTINRDTQVGTTINIGSLSGGMYYGSNAALGNYVFGNVGSLTGADFSGSITNVVQNTADPGFATGNASSFLSGNFSFGGASFGFEFLNPPSPGPILYTDPTVPFQFTTTIDGLPNRTAATLVNSGTTNILNIYFNNTLVAQSYNRTILLEPSSVPEPASILMMGLGALSLLGYTRVRRARILAA